MKKCRNNCIFCFIEQLPINLRDTLYIKDDDYLESFKYGNFITLTNLSSRDIENILKYSLSPLYVSFHSESPNIREILYGNKNTGKAADILKIFNDNNINVHIQIVLCPKINDGENLIRNLDFLNNNFKNILSVGIVPVGITSYNKNPLLLRFDKNSSKELIETVNNYNQKNKYKKNVFLSDEFYIMAGTSFPEYKAYGDFVQIENGIGLSRNFVSESESFLKVISKNIKVKESEMNGTAFEASTKYNIKTIENRSKNILILTSEYFYETMNTQVEKIKRYILEETLNLNLNLKVNYIKNYFFGGNVKVFGLLTHHDFLRWHDHLIAEIKQEFCEYDKIVMPNIIFNNDGLTLDNKIEKDFLDIYRNIKFIDPDGKSFLKEIFDL